MLRYITLISQARLLSICGMSPFRRCPFYLKAGFQLNGGLSISTDRRLPVWIDVRAYTGAMAISVRRWFGCFLHSCSSYRMSICENSRRSGQMRSSSRRFGRILWKSSFQNGWSSFYMWVLVFIEIQKLAHHLIVNSDARHECRVSCNSRRYCRSTTWHRMDHIFPCADCKLHIIGV
jgi:hypothetical protein